MGAVLATLFIVPILCGVVGGVGLVVYGRWAQLGLGVALYLTSSFVLGILELPSIGLIAVGTGLYEDGHTTLGGLLSWLSLWWQRLTFLVAVAAIHLTFIAHSESSVRWALTLWAFAVSVGVLATEERGLPEDLAGAAVRCAETWAIFALWVAGLCFGLSAAMALAVVAILLGIECAVLSHVGLSRTARPRLGKSSPQPNDI